MSNYIVINQIVKLGHRWSQRDGLDGYMAVGHGTRLPGLTTENEQIALRSGGQPTGI